MISVLTKYDFFIYGIIFISILYINGCVIFTLIKNQKFKEDPIINFNIKLLLGFLSIIGIISILSLFKGVTKSGIFLAEDLFIAFFILIKIKSLDRTKKSENPKTLSYLTIGVILLSLANFVIHSSNLLGKYIFPGSDLRTHILYTNQILWTKSIPLTLEPYIHTFNTYTMGLHAISSFFVLLTNFDVTKIVTITGIFAYILIPLAMYHLTKVLTNNKYLAFISALLITFFDRELALIHYWGGIPYLYTFYFGLVFVALFSQILFDLKNNTFYKELVLYFIYAVLLCLVMNPIGLILFALFILPILLINFEKKFFQKKFISNFLKEIFKLKFFIPLLIGLLIIVPYFFGFILDFLNPLSQYSTKSSIKLPPEITSYGLDWFSKANLTTLSGLHRFFDNIMSHSIILFVASLLAIVLSLILLKKFYKIIILALSWCLLFILVGTNSPLGLYFIDIFGSSYILPARVFGLFLIPLIFLSSLTIYFIYITTKELFDYLSKFNKLKFKFLKIVILAMFIFIIFLILPTILKEFYEYQFGIPERGITDFTVLTRGDLIVMDWISNNTLKDDIILVSWADAGQFIPSYTKRIILEPWSILQFDPAYLNLTQAVITEPDTDETLNLLKNYNIKYIFIGSKTERGRLTFDLNKLYFSNNYINVFNSGKSSLFRVNYNKASTILDAEGYLTSINSYYSDGKNSKALISQDSNNITINPSDYLSRVNILWNPLVTQKLLGSKNSIVVF